MWTPEGQLYAYPNEAIQLGREKACWESNPVSHTFDTNTLPLCYAPTSSHGILNPTSLYARNPIRQLIIPHFSVEESEIEKGSVL